MPVAKVATSNSLWKPEIAGRLQRAVVAYDLPQTKDWGPVAALSANALFEGIEVYGADAIVENGQFVAAADVFVKMVDAPGTAEAIEFHDSYPARVKFSVSEEGVPTIVAIEVDTRSFYE
jgi:hypothetical protein